MLLFYFNFKLVFLMIKLKEYSKKEVREMKGLFLFLFKHIENLTHENCVVNVNAFLYAAYNIEKDYNDNARAYCTH